MQDNKGLIIVLTVVVSLLCLYTLSFTWKARQVQDNAITFATKSNGVVDLTKKQQFLDSVWNVPVYNFLGIKYTYKEVKENELAYGLDLQGGMHVTLEVSPVDIIKRFADNSQDSAFRKALALSSQMQKTSQESYQSLFFKNFKSIAPKKSLASIFANANTRGIISRSDSDETIQSLINTEVDGAIERSFTILRNRIDQFGTSQPNIQRLPNGRIQIEIPGADNPQRVRKLLQGVARLEFWDVTDYNQLGVSISQINAQLIKEQQAVATQSTGKSQEKGLQELLGDTTKSDTTIAKGLDSLTNTTQSPLFSLSSGGPGTFRYSVKDTAAINKIFRRIDILKLLPPNTGVYWANKEDEDLAGNLALQLHFLEKGRTGIPKLTGEVITSASNTTDEKGNPAVSMNMNAKGTQIWASWTREASVRKGQIAIVLDNQVYSAPSVNGEIPTGNSQISGNFTVEEAKDLALVLKAGSLPAPTRIIEEAIIGPTLGDVAKSQGFISMICGLILVVVFMVAYYGKGGTVANLALVFNVFFILGILAQLDAALTLPGIAGIVLTMGMAVDANVIIFERIREEMREGRKLREAIARGFNKSFWTIFDSNVTTFLTAAFLFFLGQGPVKGFAITLMVGLGTTFFTAVYISHVVIDWMVAKRGDDTKLDFTTAISKKVASDINFDFIGKRKIAYIFSSTFIIIGLVLILIQGLNLGVDFKGGRSYTVSFANPVVATDMKIALSKSFGNAGTEVKNFGSNNVVKVTTSYLTDSETEDADEQVKTSLIKGLEDFTKLKFTPDDKQVDASHFSISSSTKVGATIADDIKFASLESAIYALIAIFLYILVRFNKVQFGIGAIVALIHDALFVFAAFAIARAFGIAYEIDQVFVAAILTVIGYSINDTVIIFDRIREYIGMGTGHSRNRIFNDAINSTLNRTIITSGTTLLVVVALLLFGGEVLSGFSFALFVGIGIGTYSSIFIAAPIVIDFDRKGEKDFQKKA